MHIRPALVEDADALCTVLRRSIIELRIPDHHNDREILSHWLANKTPDQITRWIVDPSNAVLVAVEDNALLAGGCVKTDGEIVLNYVSPDARFRGVSRAMMTALEAISRINAHTVSRLDSTTTALRFYEKLGYRASAAPIEKFGLMGYPLEKSL